MSEDIGDIFESNYPEESGDDDGEQEPDYSDCSVSGHDWQYYEYGCYRCFYCNLVECDD